MPIIGVAALSVTFVTMLLPRWELKALSGAEVTYYNASIRYFAGMFVALLAATGIGAGISLVRDPHDPFQRSLGGLIASSATLAGIFLVARVPAEYRTVPFKATGWVTIGGYAALVAVLAFAGPLAATLHGKVLDDAERQGEGHPDLAEFESGMEDR